VVQKSVISIPPLDITVRNSYFLYKKSFDCVTLTFKDFRDTLIKNMIQLPVDIKASQLINSLKFKHPNKKRPMAENEQHFQEKISLPPQWYNRKSGII